MKIRYFDHAATTKLSEEVLKEMLPYMSEEYGNPSAIYSLGVSSKKAIEDSREKVATILGANRNEIYFTSCGSESDNMAIKGVASALKNKGNHIITSKIEHPAVLETCTELEKQGFKITYLNVDKDGIIDLKELENSIKDTTILISIMFANNEIGTIEPIKEIGEIAKKHNIYFHTDAVQAVGALKIDVRELNIDLLSLSAHKFYGPKGVGAIYIKKGVKIDKYINGGHQERNKRAGTENVSGIVGLGKALEISYDSLEKNNKYLGELRDYYLEQVTSKINDIKINGHKTLRLPGNSNISFKGIDGTSLIISLDMKGICASSGSACTSGSIENSHVLTAIGNKEDELKGSLRVTFGPDNTKEDVDYLVSNLVEIIDRLRKI